MTGQSATLHGAFAEAVRRHADRPAVSDEAGTLTYTRLDEESDALAAVVRRSVGGPRLAAVRVGRRAAAVTAIVGVLKADCGYMPVDPDYPAARRRMMLDDASVSVIVTDAVEPGETVVGRAGALCVVSRDVPDGPTLPDGVAYVMYTSGSTGAPKACVVTHANVLALMRAAEGFFDFGPDQVWTLFHSTSFDFSVWEMWGALLHGAQLIVVAKAVSIDPESTHALLAEYGVTVFNQVPSNFTHLVRHTAHLPALPALRMVIFGGEALQPAAVTEWKRRGAAPAAEYVNMYGITETTVHVTHCALSENLLTSARPGWTPIGKALPHLRVSLYDEDGEPVQVGEAGELWVSGAGVAAGYLDRPELTAERFVTLDDGAVAYRSGDWAVSDGDGQLYSLGRRDRQVKVRGFRIELGEVEAAICALPGVALAVCKVEHSPSGHQILVGYFLPEREAEVDTETLRRHAAALLPAHMRPQQYTRLDGLPLGPNHKLDAAALDRIGVVK